MCMYVFWVVHWQAAQLLSPTPTLYIGLQHTAGPLACSVQRLRYCRVHKLLPGIERIVCNGWWNDAINASRLHTMPIYRVGSLLRSTSNNCQYTTQNMHMHGTVTVCGMSLMPGGVNIGRVVLTEALSTVHTMTNDNSQDARPVDLYDTRC